MISPQIHIALARIRQDDRRRTVAYARDEPVSSVGAERSVTLRFGSPADEKALVRLASLDSSLPPTQPVLLAEVDGQLLAALALTDGKVVADPFHRTADLIDLLRARARHLDGEVRERRPERSKLRLRVRTPAWR